MIGLLHGTQSDPGTFAGNYYWFTVMHPEYCPHALIDPSTGESIRFVSHDLPSKALQNLSGGVETNNRPGGVYQIEIVGRAEDFWGYGDLWYLRLNQFLRETEALTGIAPVFVQDMHRFSFTEWMNPALQGWYGHYNVPENDHWDPGTLNLSKLEPIMAAMDLNLEQTVYAHPGGDRTKPLEAYSLGNYLTYVLDCANMAEKQTQAVAGIANGVSAILTLLQNGAASGGPPAFIDTQAIANAVANELWRRLEK